MQSLLKAGLLSILVAGPQEASVGQITQFQKLFLAPGFLVYGSILIAVSLAIIFYWAPKFVSCLHLNMYSWMFTGMARRVCYGISRFVV